MTAFEYIIIAVNVSGLAVWLWRKRMSHQTAQATLTLSGPTALSITTTALPGFVPQQPYTAQLAAQGGTQPYTWSLAVGSALPDGLTLDPTGKISGTPTVGGTFSDTFIVTDAS